MADTFVKDWSLKWVEGIVRGYARGTLDRRKAFAMLASARAKFHVTDAEFTSVLKSEGLSPVSSVGQTPGEKKQRLKELARAWRETPLTVPEM